MLAIICRLLARLWCNNIPRCPPFNLLLWPNRMQLSINQPARSNFAATRKAFFTFLPPIYRFRAYFSCNGECHPNPPTHTPECESNMEPCFCFRLKNEFHLNILNCRGLAGSAKVFALIVHIWQGGRKMKIYFERFFYFDNATSL